jgi:hypothetical protein
MISFGPPLCQTLRGPRYACGPDRLARGQPEISVAGWLEGCKRQNGKPEKLPRKAGVIPISMRPHLKIRGTLRASACSMTTACNPATLSERTRVCSFSSAGSISIPPVKTSCRHHADKPDPNEITLSSGNNYAQANDHMAVRNEANDRFPDFTNGEAYNHCNAGDIAASRRCFCRAKRRSCQALRSLCLHSLSLEASRGRPHEWRPASLC